MLGSNKQVWEIDVDKGTTYEKLLETIDINPETVIVIRDGFPVPIDDLVEEGEIKLLRVISGG
jgi:sulfur carrier protein